LRERGREREREREREAGDPVILLLPYRKETQRGLWTVQGQRKGPEDQIMGVSRGGVGAGGGGSPVAC